MTRKLEIWVESAGAWRDLKLNAARLDFNIRMIRPCLN